MSEAFNSDVDLTLQIGFDASGPLDTSFTWTDITAYLRSFATKTGRGHERDTVSAGTATFVLDNSDRRFEPDNTGSPYTPNVRPMRPIRITATYNTVTYPVWYGYIEAWPQSWPHQRDAVSVVKAVDGFRVLAFWEVADAEVQELSGTRVGNLLDSASWPAGWRSLDTGDYQVSAHTPDCAAVLGEIERVVRTEDGLFFMGPDGDATFHDSSHRSGAAIQATFGDFGSHHRYTDLTLNYDDLQVWNDVTVAAVNVAPQAADDTASVTEFGRRKLKVFDTLHISAANALAVAQALRDRYKDPGIRVEQISIDPQRDTDLWPQVLGRTLSDKIRVYRTPPADTGTIQADVFIEGIDHSVDAASRTWRTTWLLSTAPDDPNATVVADPAQGILSAPAVTVYTELNATPTPATAELPLTVPAVTVFLPDAWVTLTAASLSLTAPAVVTLTDDDATATPAAAVLSVTAPAVSVAVGADTSPAAALMPVTAPAVTISAGAGASPAAASLSLTAPAVTTVTDAPFAYTHRLSAAGSDLSNTGDYTTSSFTPSGDALLFASVSFQDLGSAAPDNTGITITISDSQTHSWTKLEGPTYSEQGDWGLTHYTWYTTTGSSPSSMTITFSPSNGSWEHGEAFQVFDVTGQAASTPIVQNKSNGATKSGGDSESNTTTFDSTPTSGHSVILISFSNNDVSGAQSVPTGFTSINNLSGIYCGSLVAYHESTTATAVTVSDLGQTVYGVTATIIEVDET